MDWTKYIDEDGVVTIPSSVNKIDDCAYYDNKFVKEFVVEEGVIEIGNYAFGFTTAVDLNIPIGLEKVSGNAFMECDSLRSITVACENRNYR